MQFFLEFLTKALLYVSIAAVALPIIQTSMKIFMDDDSLKPNAPSMLWSMSGGIIVFFITVVLMGAGILPDIVN